MFKKSLKSNRWDKIDLGPTPASYTHENMVDRWVVEKNKWLQVSQASTIKTLLTVTFDMNTEATASG